VTKVTTCSPCIGWKSPKVLCTGHLVEVYPPVIDHIAKSWKIYLVLMIKIPRTTTVGDFAAVCYAGWLEGIRFWSSLPLSSMGVVDLPTWASKRNRSEGNNQLKVNWVVNGALWFGTHAINRPPFWNSPFLNWGIPEFQATSCAVDTTTTSLQ